MAGRMIEVVNVREIIRRVREDETDSATGSDLSVNRHTVSKYGS